MKSMFPNEPVGNEKSLPPRGAWIEILLTVVMVYTLSGRSPHGERGLKLPMVVLLRTEFMSLPPRGAWIEIACFYRHWCYVWVAPPTGSVD